MSACALQVLKQKRLYEGQREQLYQQQYNIDQTKFTVDSIKDTMSTVKVRRQALAIQDSKIRQAGRQAPGRQNHGVKLRASNSGRRNQGVSQGVKTRT